MGKNVSPPRICVIRLSHFPGDPRLDREVRALVESGFAVDIICIKRGNEKGRERLPDIDILRMPLHHRRAGRLRYVVEYSLSFLLAFVLVSYLHVFRRYKVIQVNTLPDFLVFVTLLPKLLGARILLDLQEVTPELYASKFKLSLDSPQVRLMALLEKLSARFAHSVLCVSEPTQEVLVQRGTPPQKIQVVMNVADESLFYPRDLEGINANGDGGLHLMCHGTIVERYGFQTVVEAVALLKGTIPGLHVSILGEGEYFPHLRVLAAKLGVEEYITFHGYIPLHDIPSHVSNAHAGVVPNLSDCFTDLVLPTKLMEYVAMERPVIVSRTRAVERYFDDSMVLFFEPGRPEDLARRIVELYHQREKGAELVRNARQFTKDYSWQSTKESYINLIRHLANGTNRQKR